MAQAAVAARSDARVDAIRFVVASAALRLIPNLPRHTYRRIISVAEAILLDTVAMGDRAFLLGFDVAIREALDFAGLGQSSREDAFRVLDAAADDLQWRGKGADPATWQHLLRPLEDAIHPSPVRSTPRQAARSLTNAHSGTLLRPEPALRAGQIALAILFLLLLVPMLPFAAWLRVLLLVGSLVCAGYLTFFAVPARP
jgi:hypothetical protein